ncbi:MAG TPA: hypothetical protein VFZ77_03045, partial [Acidimicrobiales bacterium]
MIRLVRRLVVVDLRAAPGRAVATAVILAVACLLPAAMSSGSAAGAVVAFAVAVASATGAAAAHERRSAVLALNGSGPGVEAGVAAATVAGPGVLAAAMAAAGGRFLSPGPAPATILLVAVVVPVVAAPPAALLLRRGTGAAPATAVSPSTPGTRWRRVGWVLLVGVVGLLSPAVLLAWLAAFLASPRRAHRAPSLVAGLGLALAVVVGTTLMAGSVEDWFSLALTLLVFGPAAAASVAVLGTAVLDGVGWAGARVGPWARIALTPLTTRSRSIGPVVGILAVTTSLAAVNATVGASFGQREEDRERTLPTVTAPAGTAPDQAIGTVGPVDPEALRRAAGEVAAATGTRAVVVERLGVGATATHHGPGGVGSGGDLLSLFPPTVYLGSDPDADAPIWLGVVEPPDLAPLGLAGAAQDLAAGRVVILDPALATPAGTVTVSRAGGAPTTMPAAPATGPTGGAGLPGGLVSRATAESLGGPIVTARVVVVPAPGRSVGAETVRAAAYDVVARARRLAPLEPAGLSAAEQSVVDLHAALASARDTVHLGSDRVVLASSGPLNDVPVLAGTREEGRARLVALGALALLVTVAGVGLALGASRAEDAMLDVQGAPRVLCSTIGAIQAGVLAGASSLLAAAVGVGLPALAFRVYNRHADLPDVPLVVPAEVAALLVLLPVVAAAVTALLGLGHPR